MVKRQLPTEELHRYVKQTVCSPAEVKRLWERFCRLDKQGNGRLTREAGALALAWVELSHEIFQEL